MSDDPNHDFDDDDDDDTTSTQKDIPGLRKAAKDGKAALAENELLKRQLAFSKAGIDTDTPLGKMFARSYDGPTDDVEAVKAAALEIGIGSAPKKSQAEIEADQTKAAEEQRLADAQSNLSGGPNGKPAGEEGPSPADAALLHFQKQLTDGVDPNSARRDAVAMLISAGLNGDKRAFVNAEQHLAAGRAEDQLVSGRG